MADENEDKNIIEVQGFKNRDSNSYFNIRNFRSEIWNGGIASPNRYLVSFSPFSIASGVSNPLSNFVRDFKDTLVMRCDTANLPGVNIMTESNIRRYGYGPVEHVAHGVTFNDITLNWIVDKRGLVNRFFHDWVSTIVNFNSKGGMDMRTETKIGSGSYSPYEVGYKDDYANYKMSVVVYDEKLKTAIEYEIFDVFPRMIMDTPLNWAETDSLLRLSVTFGYTDINIKKIDYYDFDAMVDSIPSLLATYITDDLLGKIF